MKRQYLLILVCIFGLWSCNTKTKKSSQLNITEEVTQLSKADLIIEKSIKAHGGHLYNDAYFSFVFRDNTYTFKNDNQFFRYSKSSNKNGKSILDVLKNGKLSRTIDGKDVILTPKEINAASNALNSVIYFATLPSKLNDTAVNKTFIGETTIKNKSYNIVEITFNEKDGGQDHDDQFYYWINKNTHKIDYLAYNYEVNKGGVRFRSAYNTRVIDSVTFQDYINYKAEVGTPLKDLPTLYEANKLKELSKIKTENIINLN